MPRFNQRNSMWGRSILIEILCFNQDKIPRVLNLFPYMFFLWHRNNIYSNSTSETCAFTNANNITPLSRWCPHNWKFTIKAKILQISHYNPARYIIQFQNFRTVLALEVNSLCKNMFLIFLGKFPVFFCLEKLTSKLPVFSVPWQPWQFQASIFRVNFVALLCSCN